MAWLTLYLYDAAVDAVVRVPEAPVIPPLPDGPLRGLGAALLQHGVHRKDALSGQAGHQLTAGQATWENHKHNKLCNPHPGFRSS